MWLQAVQQQSVAVRSARVRYAAVCAQKDAAEVARARATAASMSGWSVGEVAVLMSHLGAIRHAYEHTEHTVVLVMQVICPRCGLSRAMQHMHIVRPSHVRWTGRRSHLRASFCAAGRCKLRLLCRLESLFGRRSGASPRPVGDAAGKVACGALLMHRPPSASCVRLHADRPPPTGRDDGS